MPFRNDRLKQRRQARGIAQQDLAQMLQVSQQQIARWENAANDPSTDALAHLAQALDCTADWLLGLVDQPHAHAPGRALSADEQMLVELYRQRRLPEIISRMVNELAAAKPQENVVVNGTDKP